MKYRLSDYTITVDLDNTDKVMLVHGYTGAIDIASKQLVDYLKETEIIEKEIEEFGETLKTLVHKLAERGHLTEKTPDEEKEYIATFYNVISHRDKVRNPYFLFLVAYECNFRCPYCYEKDTTTAGKKWTKKVFTKDMVDKAYHAMLKIEPDRDKHSKFMMLYGGEPLLRENKEIVEYIVTKGQSMGYKFGAITNGYDLHHFQDLLAPDKIGTLQITMDGIKERHDRRRIHYQGKSTFDRILENIGLGLERGCKVSVRINTDKNNFGDLEKLGGIFNELGFTQYEKFMFSSCLLIDYSANSSSGCQNSIKSTKPRNLSFLSRPEFNDKHNSVGFKFNCQDQGLHSTLTSAILKGNNLYFKASYCAVQTGEYIFDPLGYIYSCWNHVGTPDESFGRYDNDIIEWTEQKDKWQNRNLLNIDECRKCKYILLCGGGCSSSAYIQNEKIESPACDSFENTFSHAAKRAYKTFINEKK